MFSQASVSHSVQRRGVEWVLIPRVVLYPLGGGNSTPGYMDLGYYGIRLTSGRYTSYWNAFLFLNNITLREELFFFTPRVINFSTTLNGLYSKLLILLFSTVIIFFSLGYQVLCLVLFKIVSIKRVKVYQFSSSKILGDGDCGIHAS